MDIDDVEKELGFRPKHQLATLTGFIRVYNKYSEKWDGGAINMRPHNAGKIIGLLLEGLSETDVEKLRQRDEDYSLLRVRVKASEGKEVEAVAFYSEKTSQCRPSVAYLDRVVNIVRKIGDKPLLANVLETVK